jgi:hypothetical protein
MSILFRTLAGAALLSLTLTGCSSGGDASYSTEEMLVSAPSEMGFAEDSGELSTESSMDNNTRAQEPDVITTGYVSLVVDSPEESADEVVAIVSEAGGRVSSRFDYSPTDFGSPSASLELRIPADALESTIKKISAVGDIQESSINSFDVALQKVDLDARIEVLSAAQERLATLLTEAETTADIVAIESALSERQAELYSLTSQREYLSDQTLFATVMVNFQTPADALPRNPDGFVDGLAQGWQSILAFFAGTIVWAGILLPWLGLVAVVSVIALVVRRLRARTKNTSD